MLTHKYRFHGHKSLGFVFRHGKVVRGRHLMLRINKHPHRVHSRVAVVVSKKVSKRAHERNRIRRRIYEAMRTSWNEVAAPYDIVFTVTTPEVGVMPASELKDELLGLLHQGAALHSRKDNT